MTTSWTKFLPFFAHYLPPRGHFLTLNVGTNGIFWTSCCPRSLWTSQDWGHSRTAWTRKGGRWSKRSLFLSTFRVKNIHLEVGGGQKRAKLCPRSHRMPPIVSTSPAGGFLCMMGLSAILEWTFDYRWMTNDVRPERPTATTSSPLIPGLWAASPAVWGCPATAEAYEMKVMWRAVSTTFTFRQQRLTKVIS